MNKLIAATTLFLTPMVCMNVYADNITVAQNAFRGTFTELTTIAQNAKTKDLEPLISEIHTVLQKNTPGVLNSLTSLTAEERINLFMSLAMMPELAALQAAVEPLSEGKAAATLQPLIAKEDAAAAVAVLSMPAKLQLIDIVSNLTKVAVALGVDTMAVSMLQASEATN